MSTTPPVLNLDRFEELAVAGEITTVICAAPDPYGRLVGKRLTIPAFRSLGLQGSGVNASSFIFGVEYQTRPGLPELVPIPQGLNSVNFPVTELYPTIA